MYHQQNVVVYHIFNVQQNKDRWMSEGVYFFPSAALCSSYLSSIISKTKTIEAIKGSTVQQVQLQHQQKVHAP
jgi:hypothetical protein